MKRNRTASETSVLAEGGPDVLVPDAQVARELGGCSKMMLWRLSNDPAAGFPVAVKIKRANHRWRSELEAYKRRLTAQALAARNKKAAA